MRELRSAMLSNLWARRDPEPGEQLLELYSNRADVKRELTSLRRERRDLLDKLSEQEGTILRAQEQLQGLERLLIDPQAAANAMVYFQLRHLWRVCAQKIEQFSGELRTQREQRERAQLHEAALAKRGRRLRAVGEKLESLVNKQQTLARDHNEAQEKLARMNGFLRFFKGPSLRRRIASLEDGKYSLNAKINELRTLQDRIEGEPLPEPAGLSLESRRMINLAVIALAQHLVVHFSEHDIIGLTKAATQCPVGDMKFGDRRDCDRMVERIRERIEKMRREEHLADEVRSRADYLVNQVSYKDETDAVPRIESIATVAREISDADGGIVRQEAPLPINVLLDEYWDISSALC